MDIRIYLALVALALLAFTSGPAEACMCMPAHPQTHYCNADYVALIRVMRKSQLPNTVAYKVELKKMYKKTEAGYNMFKHGRISTPSSDSLCGVELQIGRLYLIAGKAPQLNLCSYVKEYVNMTVIERRGFNGSYQKGCKCEVKPCFGESCHRKYSSSSFCKWSPYATCERDFSACLPRQTRTPEGVITKCHWRRTSAYKQCMSDP